MKKIRPIMILVFAGLTFFTTLSGAQSVKSILTEMDQRMNKNAQMKFEIQVWKDHQMTDDDIFSTKAKHNNQYFLMRCLYPPEHTNTRVLMANEDVWIYDQTADRFMQMPAHLAFGGSGFSHGDILRLNISKNYDGTIIREDQTAWTVNLFTQNKDIAYRNLEITINKRWFYPVTAKCFSKTGKLIKTVEYSEVKEMNGTMKPTKYTFLSPYEPERYTIIKIHEEKLAEYPDYLFNKWVLKSGIDSEF